ncbi:UNVERIFIED_CONTAM: hypothetical protein Scaly_1860600 [Sesamum calycinum]|uniref:Avr9/Cf-9 rapidly elicited protein 146 n=1 Tax=Sesamum calycinum TaxID=2727403 RepID=A0AAW2NGT9_9LAMI
MEQNLPVIAKKFWHIVKVVYFMLRKGISKAKLLADLNIAMKRGKIAGKSAMHNLMFHHAAATAASSSNVDADPQLAYPVPVNEYEFSCSNSPAFHLPFHLNKRKRSHKPVDGDLLAAALEVVNSAAASPALPGFGRTPMVRQLRITDSPFPLRDVEEDSHVDEAAEKFIKKFYRDLRQQNAVAS